jgi:hypothetical protein
VTFFHVFAFSATTLTVHEHPSCFARIDWVSLTSFRFASESLVFPINQLTDQQSVALGYAALAARVTFVA